MKRLARVAAIVLACSIAATPAIARHHKQQKQYYPQYQYHQQYHQQYVPVYAGRYLERRHRQHYRKTVRLQYQQYQHIDRLPTYADNTVKRHHVSKKKGRRNRTPHWIDTTNTMVQVETVQGFKITVHPAYADKFLKFFALLEEHGYKPPKNMVGCYSQAHKRGSNHAIGAACDIQTGWNRAPSFMYHVGPLIKQAGLYDGCSFGDCGHVEAVRGLYNHAPNLYASLEKFKADQSTANYQP